MVNITCGRMGVSCTGIINGEYNMYTLIGRSLSGKCVEYTGNTHAECLDKFQAEHQLHMYSLIWCTNY